VKREASEEDLKAKNKTKRVYDAPNKGILWGWEVSAYIWTKAISTGVFLTLFMAMAFGLAPVAAEMYWFGIGTSLLFLALTGAFLVKDLDKPSRFLNVLLRPQWRSWLVRGGYSITFYGALLSLNALAYYQSWEQVWRISAYGGAFFAVLTAVYTAFLFAQAKGRDFWQSPTLPLHMLAHAFMAGAAFLAILSLFVESSLRWRFYLQVVFYASLSFNLIILLVELATPHPTQDAKRVVNMILSGKYRLKFWLGVVLTGNIIPLLLIWFSGSEIMITIGAALILVGIYITEHIWVKAPQEVALS
jgi:formate-dependent nitrite reductase membrane component NrfD